MNPVQVLLARPSSLSGLGTIALCSALAGPLSLEIIFNHADLWFKGQWQDRAFPLVWVSWTVVGLFATTPWGLDRGFNGITKDLHAAYSILLSLIGVSVYLFFSLPTWSWLYSMSLVELGEAFTAVLLSGLVLVASAGSASVIEQRTSSLFGLLTGLLVGFILTQLTWSWLLTSS